MYDEKMPYHCCQVEESEWCRVYVDAKEEEVEEYNFGKEGDTVEIYHL